MFEGLKKITNKWFYNNNKNAPELRHEFPLHDISDNLHFGEDPGNIAEEYDLNLLEHDPTNKNENKNGMQ